MGRLKEGESAEFPGSPVVKSLYLTAGLWWGN